MESISLNLPSYQDRLIIHLEDEKKTVWDPVRRKKIILQPEELVRQLFIQYLIHNNYPITRIAVEKGFDLNGIKKRFDLAIYDKNAKPYILVECKSFSSKINQKVLDQLLGYNLILNSSYQIITNGVSTFCFQVNKNKKRLESISAIPFCD